MTLDLNGSELSGNGARYLVVRNGGKLTIEDSTGNGAILNNNAAIRVVDGGEVILNSGHVESTANSAIVVGQKTAPGGKVTVNGGSVKAQEVAVLAVYPGAVVEINGGNLTTTDNFVVGGNGTEGQGETDITINGGVLNGNITSAGYVACGIYHPQKGKLAIHGGTINANGGAGIVMRGGELDIDGGTINATGADTLVGKVGDSAVPVTTSALVVDKKANYYDAGNMLISVSNNAELNGSKSAVDVVLGDGQSIAGQLEITGGTFSSDVNDYVASGYTSTEVSSGV